MSSMRVVKWFSWTWALALLVSACGSDETVGTASGVQGAGTTGASGVGPGPVAGASGLGGSAGVAGATSGVGNAGTGSGIAGAAGLGGRGGIGGSPGTAGMPAAGASGEGGAAGMAMGGTSGGGGGVTLPTGPEPMLPAIQGECPEFVDGADISVAGHGSIVLAVGPKGMGGPLVFYWHGTGGSAAEAMRTVPAVMRSEIMAAGGIIAAFNGDESSGTEGDCSGTAAHNMADFKAADQIAACAVRDHGIDPRRIYATGCSAGGLQSGCMAQMRSSYLAASAPNSGGVVRSQPWQDEHTPAVFTMHGGSSDMVIVTFSQTSATFDMAAKSHGGFVVNCNHGGGHCQAPEELRIAAWQFMKDHPWGFDPSPWAAGIPAGVPDYCEIY